MQRQRELYKQEYYIVKEEIVPIGSYQNVNQIVSYTEYEPFCRKELLTNHSPIVRTLARKYFKQGSYAPKKG